MFQSGQYICLKLEAHSFGKQACYEGFTATSPCWKPPTQTCDVLSSLHQPLQCTFCFIWPLRKVNLEWYQLHKHVYLF